MKLSDRLRRRDGDNDDDFIDQCAAELDRLEAREKALVECLRSLADHFDAYRADWSGLAWYDRIGLPDDLKRARAFLEDQATERADPKA